MKKLLVLLFAFIIAHGYLILKLFGVCSWPVKFFRKATPEKIGVYNRTEEIIWASYAVTTNLYWLDSCLIRSLTAVTLLRSFGIVAVLRIGARPGKDGQTVEGHAWVTDVDGNVVCDQVSDLSSYQEFGNDIPKSYFTGAT